MKWIISGADSKTGREQSVEIEAVSEANAREWASMNGILVASIVPKRGNSPDYATHSAIPATPTYLGLQLGIMFMRVAAVVLYVLSGMSLATIASQSSGAAYRMETAVQMGLYPAIGGLVSAILFHAISGACQAVRDIAINSFRR